MRHDRIIWLDRVLLVLALACIVIGPAFIVKAHATDDTACTETGWQRYSWTGGPHASDDPPAFPSDDWQPNVKGDPHNVGVEGAYFRSHGNSGNGDWFYLEATSTVVPCEEPTEEEPTVTPPVPSRDVPRHDPPANDPYPVEVIEEPEHPDAAPEAGLPNTGA